MIAKTIIKIAQAGVHDPAQISALAVKELASGKTGSVGGLSRANRRRRLPLSLFDTRHLTICYELVAA